MYELQMRSTRIKRFSACFLAMFLPFAGLSFGQGRVEKSSPLAVRVERAKQIRVWTPEGERTLLRPLVLNKGLASRIRTDGEELSGGSYNEATLISWDDVREIRIRKSAALFGALAGFGLGAAAGVALVWARRRETRPEATYFKGIAIFGFPTSLFGAAIGSAITHWKSVYTAPTGPRPTMRVSLAPMRQGGMAFSLALAF